MAAYVKSIGYCAVFGGLGYVLMKLVTPDENKMREKLLVDQSEPRTIAERKRQAIVNVLRNAAEEKEPLYRQTREQIDATLSKKKPAE